MKLHPGKCKELIVDFSKNKQVFDPITADGVRIPVGSKANVPGLTISNNLLSNDTSQRPLRRQINVCILLSSLNGQVSH